MKSFLCSDSVFLFLRQTKPLTFADCIGDELPVGWEEAYDPVVGAYYVDHNTSESPHHPVSSSSVNEIRHQSASRSGWEAAQLHEAKDRQVYGTLLS